MFYLISPTKKGRGGLSRRAGEIFKPPPPARLKLVAIEQEMAAPHGSPCVRSSCTKDVTSLRVVEKAARALPMRDAAGCRLSTYLRHLLSALSALTWLAIRLLLELFEQSTQLERWTRPTVRHQRVREVPLAIERPSDD
jgi:hypothetical protein